MDFNEALAALYLDRKKVKLPDWGGAWYVHRDGLLTNTQDNSLVNPSRIQQYATRTDFFVVEDPKDEIPVWKPLPYIDRGHFDFETKNVDGIACLTKQGYYITFRDIWKLPKQTREDIEKAKEKVVHSAVKDAMDYAVAYPDITTTVTQ